MVDVENTENFSKNKGKRGRPKKVLANGLTYTQWIGVQAKTGLLDTNLKSIRSHLNFYYLTIAMSALSDENGKHPVDGKFSFVISAGSSDIYDPKVKNFKRTVLQELGRLEDPDLIRFVAAQVCLDKLKTSEAVHLIRDFRKPKTKAVIPEDLAKKIGKVIDEFRTINSEIDSRFIMEALYITQEAYSENFS